MNVLTSARIWNGGSAKGAAECSRVNFYGDLSGSIRAFRGSPCMQADSDWSAPASTVRDHARPAGNTHARTRKNPLSAGVTLTPRRERNYTVRAELSRLKIRGLVKIPGVSAGITDVHGTQHLYKVFRTEQTSRVRSAGAPYRGRCSIGTTCPRI